MQIHQLSIIYNAPELCHHGLCDLYYLIMLYMGCFWEWMHFFYKHNQPLQNDPFGLLTFEESLEEPHIQIILFPMQISWEPTQSVSDVCTLQGPTIRKYEQHLANFFYTRMLLFFGFMC